MDKSKSILLFRGIPLRQGKQRVWVPTVADIASPTPRLYTTDKSVVGAKPPSPHLLSLKMKAQLPLAIGKETFKQKIYPLMLEKERKQLSKTQKKNPIPVVVSEIKRCPFG